MNDDIARLTPSRIVGNPSLALLVKLGSIARHVEEMTGPSPHPFDQGAIESLLRDPEVREWMQAADEMALLPVKR